MNWATNRLFEKRWSRFEKESPELYKEWSKWNSFEILQEFFIGIPENCLEKEARRFFSSESDEDIQLLLSDIRQERTELSIPAVRLPHKEIIKLGSMMELEETLSVCELTGSFPFTDREDLWMQLVQTPTNDSKKFEEQTLLAKALSQFSFNFPNRAPADLIISLREDGALSRLRAFLLDTWDTASKTAAEDNPEFKISAFTDRLEGEYERFKEEWHDIDRKLVYNIAAGASAAGVAVLSGQFNQFTALGGLAALGIQQLVTARLERRHQLREPLGVLIRFDDSV